MVQASLDPYSLRQQRRARDVAKQIADYDVPTTADAFQALFKAVYGRLDLAVQRALARRPVPPCPPNAPEAVRAQAAALLGRQFWSNLKLFQCILAWQPLLPREPVEALACRSVLPRLLLPLLSRSTFSVADLARFERVRGV